MSTESSKRPVLRQAATILGLLLVGVAVATAQNQATQNQATKPADAKAPAAAPAAKSKPDAVVATDAKAKSARRAYTLGMTADVADDGLVISKVEQGSIAGKAGLREKDRIISVDQRPFKHPRQFAAYLSSHGGRAIPIVVMRDGQQQTVMYTPPLRAGDSAWLGVYLEQGDVPASGALINQVYPDGPAARAGLQPGDIITQIDTEKIDNAPDLIATVAAMAPDVQVQFAVTRNEQNVTIPVTLGSHHQQAVVQYDNGEGEDGHHHAGHHAFDNIPPHAMRLEHDRRTAEQHQRIEEEIRALRDEIRQLREELKQSRK